MFCTTCGEKFNGNYCPNCGTGIKPTATERKTTTNPKPNMFECYFLVLSKYAIFNGRLGRREFWMFQLANIIISFGVGFVDAILGLGFVSTLYTLAILIPNLSASIRRCHDVDKSGWFCLIPLYNIILFATEGDKTPNTFGNPV